MRVSFLLIAAVGFMASVLALETSRVRDVAPPAAEPVAAQAAETFLAYRDAVRTYLAVNPTYTGAVSASALTGLGFSFPTSFLSIAGNTISATGTTGRVVSVYATLPPGGLAMAFQASLYDASIGVSNGTTWTSSAPGAVAQALPLALPSGAVVSVSQVGK